MKALVLRDDTEAAVASAQALIDKGFQVICVENRHIARALLRIETIDLLVLDERIDGRLTHSIALSAERQNPYISAILISDRPAAEVDDLFDLLPCLYGLLDSAGTPAHLGTLAMSSIQSAEDAEARVARNKAIAAAQEEQQDAMMAQEEERKRRAFAAQDAQILADAPDEDMPDALEGQVEVAALLDSISFTPALAELDDHFDELTPPLRANKPQRPYGAKDDVHHSPAA